MANVAIICHLERLWPEYETGQAYFGLNLAASFDQQAGTETEALNLLLPWKWGNVEKIHVWLKNTAELKDAAIIEFPLGAQETFDGEPIKKAVEDEAASMLATSTEGLDSFLWRPEVGSEEEQEGKRYLRNLLGYVSTLPAPTPQKLNLSLCFKIPVDILVNGDSIFAVPEFKDGTLGNAVPVASGPDGTPLRATVAVQAWNYTTDKAGLQIKSYTVPWQVISSEPSGMSFIDFNNFWIKREIEAGQQAWYGSDWTVRLESKVAGAFDLAQRLIDAFRKNIESFKQPAQFDDQTYRDGLLAFFRQSIVATSRDLAGAGVQPGADGADVAGYLLSNCRDASLENSGLLESFRLSMRGALEFYNRVQTYDEWRALLMKQIPAINATAAVRNPGEDRRRDRLEDELGELEAIQSALADENNLRRVLLAEWADAVKKGGLVVRTTALNQPRADYFRSIRPGKGETGLLSLSDGRAWALTLSDVNSSGLSGDGTYFFRVTDPQAAPVNQISLEVKFDSGKLKFRLLDADGIEKAQAEFQASTNYHLRLLIIQHGEKTWRIKPWFGTGLNIWQPIGSGEVTLTTKSKLNAAAVRVELSGAATGSVGFAPPSILFVPDDQIAAAITAWDKWVSNKAKVFFDLFSAQLEETILPPIQLRQRLAAGNIGRIWSDLISIKHSQGDEFGQLTGNLKRKLKDYLDGRITGSAPGYDDYLKLPPGVTTTAQVVNLIKASFDSFIDDFMPLLLPILSTPTEEGDSSPTEVSQGVTIQVDRLAKFVEGDLDDAQDFLRRIAGVGVLMRQSQNGGGQQSPWRCLNMAELHAEEQMSLVYAKSLVPYRLTYQNDLRQALVTYNDNPLIAKSPAVGLSGGVDLRDEFEEGDVVRIEYTPAHKNSDWAKLPPLKFGQTYDLAAFAIGNSGALPKELTAGHPAKLLGSTSDFQADLSDYIRRVKYLRRVRVGKPRFAVPGEIGQVGKLRIQLPGIPEQVLPLAGDLKLNPASVSGIPLPDPTEDMTFDTDQKPVLNAGAQNLPLLLLPYQNGANLAGEFVFGLRKPATDLVTWNRWLAKDQDAEPGPDKPTFDKRLQVWADYHRKAPKDPDQAVDENREDITLDDPAAANFFVAELVPMRAKAMMAAKTVTVNVPPPQGDDGVNLAQSPPITVRCRHGELSNITSELGSSELVVTVGKGEVVELRIYTPVNAQWFDDENLRRFHKLPPPKEGEWKKFENAFYLFSPLRMILEGVSEQLPKAEELWQAIRPDLLGSRLAVHFDRNSADANNTFDYVATVDLRRQLWRWQGRPLKDFPALKTDQQAEINKLPGDLDTPATNAFLWDAEGFGDRGDDDYMLTTTAVSLLDSSPVLFEDDRAQDLRALYYRFSVRAHSRYRGLLENNAPEFRDSNRDATPNELNEQSKRRDNWKRYLVNCRWQEEAPKPQVKFVVPLTESASKANVGKAQLPGLLVVLNETWYEVGGLAEKLLAELQEVTFRKNSSETELIPEIGPDPILTGEEWTGGKITLEVSQPIGHTFDTDAEAPLFVASSCVLSLPDVPKAMEDKWCFAKINFKRQLTVNGKDEIHSKPTDAYWVQLLPDFSEFNDNFDYDKLRLRRESATSNSVVITADGLPLTLPADPQRAGFNKFMRWLLLTQVIRDMRGRRDQERYLGLYRMGSNGVCHPLNELTQIGNSWKLRARIVEAQYRTETLGNLRGSAGYYDGASLSDGKQWAILLLGIETNFGTAQGEYSLAINKSGFSGASLLSVVVTHITDGSVRLQLKQGGDNVGQPKTINSGDAVSPYALRLILTKSVSGWSVSAQHQFGDATWQEFAVTTLDTLGNISIRVALAGLADQTQALSFITPALTAEPWDHFFPLEMPGATPEDAKARFVRVSRPIEMEDDEP